MAKMSFFRKNGQGKVIFMNKLMNIPIFRFLWNAATRWTPRTSQNIAAKLRYSRSNILFRIFQVFFKKNTNSCRAQNFPKLQRSHRVFPASFNSNKRKIHKSRCSAKVTKILLHGVIVANRCVYRENLLDEKCFFSFY